MTRTRWTKEQAVALGRRLRETREAMNLSQRELAEGTTVTAAYISRIEKGERYPGVPILRQFAARLGVTAEWLEFGIDRTMTDDLLDRLVALAPHVACGAMAANRAGFVVAFEYGDEEHVVAGDTLTDALRRAVAHTETINLEYPVGHA
jgi:transcriptional regulator with XRE-family HTH domain